MKKPYEPGNGGLVGGAPLIVEDLDISELLKSYKLFRGSDGKLIDCACGAIKRGETKHNRLRCSMADGQKYWNKLPNDPEDKE